MVDIIIHILQKRQEGEVLDGSVPGLLPAAKLGPGSVSRPVPSTTLGLTVASPLILPALTAKRYKGKDVLCGTSFPFLQNLHSHMPPGLPQPFSGAHKWHPSSPHHQPWHLSIPVSMPPLPILATFAWILEPLGWFPPPVFPSPNASWQIHFKIQALIRH